MIDLDRLANLQDIREIPELSKEKFFEIYRKKFKLEPDGFFELQKNLFISEVMNGAYKEKLWQADRMSLFNAFISLAINGLSLEKGSSTECYLECRSVCVGKDERGNKVYGSHAVITISGYGELTLRKRAGQILHVGNPVIVYDCDQFQDGEWDGKRVLNYMRTIPRPAGAKKYCCFIPLFLKNNIKDYGIMYIEDAVRLAEYSKKSNGGKYMNPLYGKAADCSDIDDGFFISKALKKVFKTFKGEDNKIDVGIGSTLDDEPVANEESENKSEVANETTNGDSIFG